MSIGPESSGHDPELHRLFDGIVNGLEDTPDVEPQYVSALNDITLIRALYDHHRRRVYSQHDVDIHDLVQQATLLEEQTMAALEQLDGVLKVGDYLKASGQTVFYIERADWTLTPMQLRPGFAISGNLVAINPEAMPSDDDWHYFTEQQMGGIDPALEQLSPSDPHFPTLRLRDATILSSKGLSPIRGDVLVPLYKTLNLQRLQ